MDSNSYNSLEEQLIKKGIISSPNKEEAAEYLYGIDADEDMSHSPFINMPQKEPEYKEKKPKKRINQYDMDLMNNKNNGDSSNEVIFNTMLAIKTIKRFLNFKHNAYKKGNLSGIEGLFYKFFPNLYKAKLIKDAMSKLKELNIDTKVLLEKTVPYGEYETRYENLVKYLKFASEIQTKIK